MCGIFGTRRYKKLLKKYNQQRMRGHEGFGIINVSLEDKISILRACKEVDFLKQLKEVSSSGGRAVFVHHRWPTSTDNYVSQTHPIKVKHKSLEHTYYFMHNGVIRNDSYLKGEHDKLGFEYDTLMTKAIHFKSKYEDFIEKVEYDWNDSNALAVEVARFIEGKVEDLKQVTGDFAFICIQANKGKFVKAFIGRNSGRPLKTDSMATFGSELGSIDINPGILFDLDLDTFQTTEVKKFTDTCAPSKYNWGGYGYNAGKKEDKVEEKEDKKVENISSKNVEPSKGNISVELDKYSKKKEEEEYDNYDNYDDYEDGLPLHWDSEKQTWVEVETKPRKTLITREEWVSEYTRLMNAYPDTQRNQNIKSEVKDLLQEYLRFGDETLLNDIDAWFSIMDEKNKLYLPK